MTTTIHRMLSTIADLGVLRAPGSPRHARSVRRAGGAFALARGVGRICGVLVKSSGPPRIPGLATAAGEALLAHESTAPGDDCPGGFGAGDDGFGRTASRSCFATGRSCSTPGGVIVGFAYYHTVGFVDRR